MGGVKFAVSKSLLSKWLCEGLLWLASCCPGEPDEGRIEFGRHSKRRSGSTGLLKWKQKREKEKGYEESIFEYVNKLQCQFIRKPKYLIHQDQSRPLTDTIDKQA